MRMKMYGQPVVSARLFYDNGACSLTCLPTLILVILRQRCLFANLPAHPYPTPSHPNSLFFSFEIHCLQMLHLFQTSNGPLLHLSHLSTLVKLFFCCIIRKYLSHIFLAESSRLLKRKFLYITYHISLYNILC